MKSRAYPDGWLCANDDTPTAVMTGCRKTEDPVLPTLHKKRSDKNGGQVGKAFWVKKAGESLVKFALVLSVCSMAQTDRYRQLDT